MKYISNIKSKFVIQSLLGFVSGMIIGVIIFLNMASINDIADNPADFIVNMLGSGVMGLVGLGGSIVYSIESWGLRKATVTHYFLSMMTFFFLNGVLEWFGSGLILLIGFVGLTLIYLMIWIIQYFIWKRKIDEINKELQEFIGENKEEHL